MKPYVTILVAVLFVNCCGSSCFAVCPSMDATGDCRVDIADFAVFAGQWLTEGTPADPQVMVWVSISDPNFTGQMSKYETTNAQYCQFLNAALASGDITVADYRVLGANGSNIEADFIDQVYYYLLAEARIHYNNGVFSVDTGFENHPVTWVSWYGAMAFCNYYLYKLPTEWQWQAVADYDGSFIYGCGTTINNSIANYYNSTQPGGTAVVGAFGTYGYGMCDMAGNVWEWTSTIENSYRGFRGGCWNNFEYHCTVSIRYFSYPDDANYDRGFRVCRTAAPIQIVVPNVTGMTITQAQSAIAAVGLVAGTPTEEFSDTVAAGNIISQNPPAAQEVLSGSTVHLVVSKGAGVNVPDVNGMPQAEAQTAITAAGLVVGALTEAYSDTVAAGNITSQNPPAGEKVLPGSTVNLVVSKGAAPDMAWVSINDPGLGSGYEGFNGRMNKYETTNDQYCQFLNTALTSGDIIVSGSIVYGANGYNNGADYANEVYYDLAGAGNTYDGAVNGGAARINYTGNSFTVDSGFENHPVTYVSWYGATAFCNYYGYKLPTEWQWQAVADYDGSFTYGCGTTINHSMANYFGSTHPDGTTAVDAFGEYGYGMCDMAGNVCEWTSTIESTWYYSHPVFRSCWWGWSDDGYICTVGLRTPIVPYFMDAILGFRVCR